MDKWLVTFQLSLAAKSPWRLVTQNVPSSKKTYMKSCEGIHNTHWRPRTARLQYVLSEYMQAGFFINFRILPYVNEFVRGEMGLIDQYDPAFKLHVISKSWQQLNEIILLMVNMDKTT